LLGGHTLSDAILPASTGRFFFQHVANDVCHCRVNVRLLQLAGFGSNEQCDVKSRRAPGRRSFFSEMSARRP
jgi:hypothetical protein